MIPMPSHRWHRVTLKIFLGLIMLMVIGATGLSTAVHLLAREKIKTLIDLNYWKSLDPRLHGDEFA